MSEFCYRIYVVMGIIDEYEWNPSRSEKTMSMPEMVLGEVYYTDTTLVE